MTFTQDLSPGSDKLLQGLPRDTRYAVRKSLKAGLDWSEDLSLQEFYEIWYLWLSPTARSISARSIERKGKADNDRMNAKASSAGMGCLSLRVTVT